MSLKPWSHLNGTTETSPRVWIWEKALQRQWGIERVWVLFRKTMPDFDSGVQDDLT